MTLVSLIGGALLIGAISWQQEWIDDHPHFTVRGTDVDKGAKRPPRHHPKAPKPEPPPQWALIAIFFAFMLIVAVVIQFGADFLEEKPLPKVLETPSVAPAAQAPSLTSSADTPRSASTGFFTNCDDAAKSCPGDACAVSLLADKCTAQTCPFTNLYQSEDGCKSCEKGGMAGFFDAACDDQTFLICDSLEEIEMANQIGWVCLYDCPYGYAPVERRDLTICKPDGTDVVQIR